MQTLLKTVITFITTYVPPVAKAVTAAVTALGSTYATALSDNTITGTEWVDIIAATVLAGTATYSIANRQPTTKQDNEDDS